MHVSIKLALSLLIVVACVGLSRIATHVHFHDSRATVSSWYCSGWGAKNLPTDPVIFVPGIKGSTLTKNGKTIWLGVHQALWSTDPFTYEEGDGVQASGLFTGLTIIPLLLEYRPYQRIAAQLACAQNGYVFSYDWRAYPDDHARAFGTLVERVINETGKQPSVIAHSMGGLIVHGYLKAHPRTINKVVYVSVPFNPGIGYFDDVNDGASVGFNTGMLSPEALITHPASFLLMPHDGSDRYAGADLLDARTWKTQKFSRFRNGKGDSAALQRIMDRIKAYHATLDKPMTLPHSMRIMVSDCHPTVFAMNADGTRRYEPGDGRVSKISAYPVDSVPNMTTSVLCKHHDAQMDDAEVVHDIFEFLSSVNKGGAS